MQQLFDGEWISAGVEVRPGGGGSQLYIKRRIINDGDHWEGYFAFFADPEGAHPALTVHMQGRYLFGKPSPVADGLEVDLPIERVLLTAHNAYFLDLFNSAAAGTCGSSTWELHVEKDVTDTHGCLPLGLDLLNEGAEYELMKREGDKLYYGARPADGSAPNRPEKRATTFQVPLLLKR